MVIKAESVSGSQRNGAIGLAQEEQISVFDDERFRDIAVDGMNLWDEIRVFFVSNGVARAASVCPCLVMIPVKINAWLQMPALQILRRKSATAKI